MRKRMSKLFIKLKYLALTKYQTQRKRTMEKPKKLQTQQGQLQCETARQRANNLWVKLVDDLNSNGSPVRDIAGWKKEQVINLLRMEGAVNGLATVTWFGTSSAIRDDSANKESAEVLLSSQNEMINESAHAAKRSSLDESFQTSKRSRLSHHDRDKILKTQVENQGIFHKQTTKLLGDVYRIH
ncbi:hypothetical protein DOY81_008564 [Sarcophaga bullata]|nr:hypothetical protein DOY81_008564 [Sarcophaga bullata]